MSEAQDSQYSQDQQRSPIGTRNREQQKPKTGRDLIMDEDMTEQTEPGGMDQAQPSIMGANWLFITAYDWLNLSYQSYKKKCKDKFLI